MIVTCGPQVTEFKVTLNAIKPGLISDYCFFFI
jgi:hypothetical protein